MRRSFTPASSWKAGESIAAGVVFTLPGFLFLARDPATGRSVGEPYFSYWTILTLALIGGVLGVLPGVIGTIQATEAIKLLAGIGETLAGRLMLYDALTMRFRELKLRRDPECPVCGDHPTVR